MKSTVVYIGGFLIIISGIAHIVTGSLAYIWLYELDDIFQLFFPYIIPIFSMTFGALMVIYSGILLTKASLAVCWSGLSLAVLFMGVFGVITLFFSGTIIDEAIYGFNYLFLRRSSPNIALVFDQIQQKFECCGTFGEDAFSQDIPDSCCPQMSCQTFMPFESACNQIFRQNISIVTDMVGWNSIVLAIIMGLTGLIMGAVYNKDRNRL